MLLGSASKKSMTSVEVETETDDPGKYLTVFAMPPDRRL